MSKFNSIPNRRGVQYRESGKRRHNGRPDVCFYIRYKVDGKLIREKIGQKSEGYSAQVAEEIRAKRIRDYRHGKTVKTAAEIRQERQQRNKTLKDIKGHYFESEKGKMVKGRKTALNRWEKHLVCIEKKRA